MKLLPCNASYVRLPRLTKPLNPLPIRHKMHLIGEILSLRVAFFPGSLEPRNDNNLNFVIPVAALICFNQYVPQSDPYHPPHRIWNLENGDCVCSLQGHWVGTHCLHCCQLIANLCFLSFKGLQEMQALPTQG